MFRHLFGFLLVVGVRKCEYGSLRSHGLISEKRAKVACRISRSITKLFKCEMRERLSKSDNYYSLLPHHPSLLFLRQDDSGGRRMSLSWQDAIQFRSRTLASLIESLSLRETTGLVLVGGPTIISFHCISHEEYTCWQSPSVELSVQPLRHHSTIHCRRPRIVV